MKPFVLYGAGQFADYVQYLLEEALGETVAAFTVGKEYMEENSDRKNNLPLIPFEEIACCYPPEQYCMALAFLGGGMFAARERAFWECKRLGYELPNIIHPTVINHSQEMGCGNIVGAAAVLAPFCSIGDANVFFDMSLISHNGKAGNFNLIASNIVPCGNSVIGNHCFIGAGSVIGNYVKLADYTLVGAGANVTKDTKPYDVVVPARSMVLEGKKSTDFKV